MPDELTFNEGDDFIRIRSHGTTTREHIEGSFEKMKSILDEFGVNKVLVDTTAVEKLISAVDFYEMFSTQLPSEFILAVVMPNEQENIRQNLKFAEDVSRNRGRFFSAFEQEEEAIRWLMEQ
jgi:hypothetical protein